MNNFEKQLSNATRDELLTILSTRFSENNHRHPGLSWSAVLSKLKKNPEKLWTLHEMEITEGEPDVTAYDELSDEFIFTDCAAESPKGRRSLCYDAAAWESRKEHRPENNAADMAAEMGIDILDEEAYRKLQLLGNFDTKTSSWLKTPESIRALGGAIFGDFRYGSIFIYHNGASSYYAARGFRGSLRV